MPKATDSFRSLEELWGRSAGNPDDAPTDLVRDVMLACKRPLTDLSDEEIGDLVGQHYGYPYVLDLIWPRLEANPVLECGSDPGDVHSSLTRPKPEVWEGAA